MQPSRNNTYIAPASPEVFQNTADMHQLVREAQEIAIPRQEITPRRGVEGLGASTVTAAATEIAHPPVIEVNPDYINPELMNNVAPLIVQMRQADVGLISRDDLAPAA